MRRNRLRDPAGAGIDDRELSIGESDRRDGPRRSDGESRSSGRVGDVCDLGRRTAMPELDRAEGAGGEPIAAGRKGDRRDDIAMGLLRAGRRDRRVDERLQQPARSRVEQAHGATAGRGRDAALVSDRDGDHSSRAGRERSPSDRFADCSSDGSGALGDPAFEQPELIGREMLGAHLVVGRRHDVVLSMRRPEEEHALSGLPRHHTRPRIAPRHDPLQGVEHEPAFMVLGVVTGGAVGGEQWLDLVRKPHLVRAAWR